MAAGADWARVSRIVADALEQPAPERPALLDRLCGDDVVLRQEVDSLLAAAGRAGSFLDHSAVSNAGSAAVIAAAARQSLGLAAGRRLGPYEIVRELGHGGMGVVYLARRVDQAYEKNVAIKVVRRDGGGEVATQLFEAERRILASLDHPYIARLMDGGTTDDGVSYLVMEYVEGLPFDRFCESRKPSLTERLQLFCKVCEAVGYAHGRLVIHRDIKARNLLVTPEGLPKLLDFGIAKLLDAGTASTQTMRRAFTLENASPEQIRGEPMTITSDVYALGVLLYSLLTGRNPSGTTATTDAEMARAICDSPPVRPTLVAAPDLRINTELEWIVLKALRKEPERRYASAAEFAGDIQRWLDGHPVLAAPDSRAYRTRKFMRRHAGAVTAAALLLLSMIGGLRTTVWQARRATEQRNIAEHRLQNSRRVAQSLLFELFDAIDAVPGATAAKALVVRRAAEQLDAIAAETPDDSTVIEELAVAYHRLGGVQSSDAASLGDGRGSIASHRQGLELRRRLAASAPDDADVQRRLVLSLIASAGADADRARALGDTEAAVAVSERLASAHPSEPRFQSALAAALYARGEIIVAAEGRVPAIPWHERAATIYARLHEADSRDTEILRALALCHKRLGAAFADQGAPQAIDHMRRAVELDEAGLAAAPAVPQRRRDLASSHIQLGFAFFKRGDHPAALEAYRRALTLRQELMGADANDMDAVRAVGSALWYIGDLQNFMSRPAEAIVSFEQALPLVLRTSTARNDMIGLVLSGLADARLNLNQLNESVAMRQQAIKRYHDVLSEQPRDVSRRRYLIISLTRLGDTHMRRAETGTTSARQAACDAYGEGLRESQWLDEQRVFAAALDQAPRDQLRAGLERCAAGSAPGPR